MEGKSILVPFGSRTLPITVPAGTDILAMKHTVPLADVPAAVAEALHRPIGSPSLAEIAEKKGAPRFLTAAVVVSDSTRPVPYRGKQGILAPLLHSLAAIGLRKEHIRIVVATGMHRPSTAEEKRRMMGSAVVGRYAVVDHDCGNPAGLGHIGKTRAGTPVSVNRNYLAADLKICTGLVESHFMAGFSGGRKSICPGLVDRDTLQRFHGPYFLGDPRADNLILAGNPCHEEAVEVACLAGCDFILNVAVDRTNRITGVYGGDMLAAHERACEDVREQVRIPLARQYDLVITHGGFVGVNHYQTAKAACAALPALKDGGTLVIIARHSEDDPIGTAEYRTLLHLLTLQGPEIYGDILKMPGWQFTRDQWEPQMWGRVMKKTGKDGIVYLCPDIDTAGYTLLPCASAPVFPTVACRDPGRARHAVRAVIQETIDTVYTACRRRIGDGEPAVAFLPDGPYGIPAFLPV